jgi:hypothetical protein
MDLIAVVYQVIELLRSHGRVFYRAPLRVLTLPVPARDFPPGGAVEEEDPSLALPRGWRIRTLGWVRQGDAESE